jgi:hypothetical protein
MSGKSDKSDKSEKSSEKSSKKTKRAEDTEEKTKRVKAGSVKPTRVASKDEKKEKPKKPKSKPKTKKDSDKHKREDDSIETWKIQRYALWRKMLDGYDLPFESFRSIHAQVSAMMDALTPPSKHVPLDSEEWERVKIALVDSLTEVRTHLKASR